VFDTKELAQQYIRRVNSGPVADELALLIATAPVSLTRSEEEFDTNKRAKDLAHQYQAMQGNK